mgnify:CR=1 FL=1
MKITFLLCRANWIRTLGPIIDIAIKDADIELDIVFFPDNDTIKPGPSRKALPERFRDECKIVEINSPESLSAYLENSDAVIAILGRNRIFEDERLSPRKPIWCAVFDALHSTLPAHGFNDADLAFWPTPFYLHYAISEVPKMGPQYRSCLGEDLNENFKWTPDQEKALRENARFSGYVRLDAYNYISPREVCERSGIDTERPVVLFIPDAYRFNRLLPLTTNTLYSHVWCADGLFKRLFGALFMVRTFEAVRKAFDINFSYTATIHAIREFCDRNGAQLVIVPRRRKEWVDRPYTEAEMEAADVFLQSNAEYPQTMMQGIAIANLVICPYRSASVLESVGGGKSFITIDLPDTACSELGISNKKIDDRLRTDWPGVAWLIDAEEFNQHFAAKNLDDFQTDPKIMADYTAKHFGFTDGKNSERLLREIKDFFTGR